MAARQYVQKEWRLLSYWLALKHPNADIAMNVRLGPHIARTPGPSPGELPSTVSRVFHRYADAVYVEHGLPTIVEAKLEPDPGIFSQLIHYARRFRVDPNWAAYRSAPLGLVALVYSDDPSVSVEAPWYGVQWEVYQPDLQELVPPTIRLAMAPGANGTNQLPDNWASRLQSWGIRATVQPG